MYRDELPRIYSALDSPPVMCGVVQLQYMNKGTHFPKGTVSRDFWFVGSTNVLFSQRYSQKNMCPHSRWLYGDHIAITPRISTVIFVFQRFFYWVFFSVYTVVQLLYSLQNWRCWEFWFRLVLYLWQFKPFVVAACMHAQPGLLFYVV